MTFHKKVQIKNMLVLPRIRHFMEFSPNQSPNLNQSLSGSGSGSGDGSGSGSGDGSGSGSGSANYRHSHYIVDTVVRCCNDSTTFRHKGRPDWRRTEVRFFENPTFVHTPPLVPFEGKSSIPCPPHVSTGSLRCETSLART